MDSRFTLFALSFDFLAWPALLFYLFHIVIIPAVIPLALIEVLPDSLSFICFISAIASVLFSFKWLKSKPNSVNFICSFLVVIALIYNVLAGVMVAKMYSQSAEINFFEAISSMWMFYLVMYCFSLYYHKMILAVCRDFFSERI